MRNYAAANNHLFKSLFKLRQLIISRDSYSNSSLLGFALLLKGSSKRLSSMTSTSHQQDYDHLKFRSNSGPCFIRIILQDTIQNGKLGIPRSFVKNHGISRSNPATLRVPSGEVWKVELTKCDGKIWFEKGWQQFSSHYSLDFGHLLVFRYDGNGNFNVIIFDKTATEIQYPHTSNNHQSSSEIAKQNIEASEYDEPIQIPGNISPSRKTREKTQLPCPRPHKMMRSTNAAIKIETQFNENNEFLRPNGCPARKDDKSTSRNTIRIKARESVKALERASNTFKSEKPFFLVVMYPSNVGKEFGPSMPADFVRKHLMKEHCSITLCNSSRKTWIVTFKQTHFRKMTLSRLENGWGTFVRDNNIQVGDVCAFELINSIKISFKVVIFKGQPANGHQPSLTSTHMFCSVKQKPPSNARLGSPPLTSLEKASALKSENPFFVIVLQPSYIHGRYLGIPTYFGRKYFTNMHKGVILLLTNGKSWPVTYHQQRTRSTTMFCHGWYKFVVDNNLEVGDACAFELIKDAETSMKVTIYKKQPVEDGNLGSSLDGITKDKKVDVHESLVTKTEEPDWMKEKGAVQVGLRRGRSKLSNFTT